MLLILTYFALISPAERLSGFLTKIIISKTMLISICELGLVCVHGIILHSGVRSATSYIIQ